MGTVILLARRRINVNVLTLRPLVLVRLVSKEIRILAHADFKIELQKFGFF
jgi:hypothetical protein